jgi:diadenosine tetraphosphate (Ap4A) HIT family hydrolase
VLCELCEQTGGELLWRDAQLRVVLVTDPDYPGFARVIWSSHVKEMTDLSPVDRSHMMAVVFAVESSLRSVLLPDKINLASLGNQTPHLHWHVIPRWTTDRHFPNPIWAQPARQTSLRLDVATKLNELRETLERTLSKLNSQSLERGQLPRLG